MTFAPSDTQRFRASADWFLVQRATGLVTARVSATAERVVDLCHALSAHLAPAVDVHMADVRTGRQWGGAFCALPDVREAIARLRLVLAAQGGVELSVYTESDQLTVTPEMQLVIYARTDRWAVLLDGMGIGERTTTPEPTWIPSRSTLRPDAPLEQALQSAAERMGIAEITT
ncbi:hypothetical protein [Gemmatimonas sp.]|uniref:hypothetical protein n=1 Tax=Gemmatimonas sp. TaxID=1962908 RepID=UPI0037C077A0